MTVLVADTLCAFHCLSARNYRQIVAELLRTERFVLRDWELDDAAQALAVYGRCVVRP